TGNTSVSPTIGIVVVPTGKIDFGPACAAAVPASTPAPASASAPVARMVLRSTLLIGVLLVLRVFLSARIYSVFSAKWIPFARYCIAIPPKKEGPRRRGPSHV